MIDVNELKAGDRVLMKSSATVSKAMRKQVVFVSSIKTDKAGKVNVEFNSNIRSVNVVDIAEILYGEADLLPEPTQEKSVETPKEVPTPAKEEAKKPVSKVVAEKCFGIFEKYLNQNGWKLTEKNGKYLWRTTRDCLGETNPKMLAEISIEAFEMEGVKKEDVTAVVRFMRKNKKEWNQDDLQEAIEATK